MDTRIKKRTFAERAKAIEKKFEGRNDKVSQRTKKALMTQLRQEQEQVRAAMELDNNTNQAQYGDLFPIDTTGLEQGLTPLSGGAIAPVAGEMPNLGGGDTSGGGGFGMDKMNDVLGAANSVMGMFGPAKSDATGKVRGDAAATKKAGIMGGVQSGITGVGKIASGDFIGGGAELIKGIGSFIGGNKEAKAINRGNHLNTLSQSYDLRPKAFGGILPETTEVNRIKKRTNDYPNGGIIGSDPTEPAEKWEPMPTDPDPQAQQEKRLHWAKRMGINAEQLSAFEDQRSWDDQYASDRDAYLGEQMETWRQGTTGHTPNKEFGQTTPEYMTTIDSLKNQWFKDNPRQVNPIVQEYSAKRKAMRQMPTMQQNNSQLANNENMEEFAIGGRINKYQNGGISNPYADMFAKMAITEPGYKNIDYNINPGPSSPVEQSQLGKTANKAIDWLGKNSGNILQYANVLGPLTHKLSRPNTPYGTRLQGTTKLDRMDDQSAYNLVNDYNVNRAVKEASAGNLGAYLSGSLAANTGKYKGRSQALNTIKGFNIGQGNKEAELKRQADLVNMQADDKYQERLASDTGAYETAKEKRRAAIFENISSIGREETDKKIVKEMYGYKWNGKYWVDSKGNRISDAEYINALKASQKEQETMFGGYIKRKR